MSLPEAIWTRLKAWAGTQANAPLSPSLDDCTQHVRSVAASLTGRNDALPPEVVTFYAAETLRMIEEIVRRLEEDAD